MTFKTRDEVLSHFENEHDMLDVETGEVYICDHGDGGRVFYGVMYTEVPEDVRGSVSEAVEYALGCIPASCMGFMEPDGGWFAEFADEVIANPERFVTE